MLNPFLSFGIYLIEFTVAYVFFSSVFDFCVSSTKSVLIGILLFSCGAGCNLLYNNHVIINGIVYFVTLLIFSSRCFCCRPMQSIFYSAILLVLNTALEAWTISLISYITHHAFLDYNNNLLLFLLEAISSKSLYYLSVLVLARIIHPKEIIDKIPATFLIYPITSTICLFIFFYICIQPECTQNIQILLAIASGCLFISSLLLFITYSHQITKENESIQLKNELLRIQTERSYYQILEQQNEQLLLYAHDVKKHLNAIQALDHDPQIEHYITALTKQLGNYTQNCHSGNKLLDVMIHKYTIDCAMRHIQFKYDIKLCNLAQVDDMDLVSIFGNLMDNAVIAAEQSQEKSIVLHTARRNAYSVIILCNSCDLPPRQSGHHLHSTKPDADFHGYGLRSVNQSLKKYQGDFDWEYNATAGTFTITVMLRETKNICKI